MNESMYVLLSNIQIATIVLQPILYVTAIVAVIFAIVTMFHGTKALKTYVARNAVHLKVTKDAAAPCLCSEEENASAQEEQVANDVISVEETAEAAEAKSEA